MSALSLRSMRSYKRDNPVSRRSCFPFLPTFRYLVFLHSAKHLWSCTVSLARQQLRVRSNPFVPRGRNSSTSTPAKGSMKCPQTGFESVCGFFKPNHSRDLKSSQANSSAGNDLQKGKGQRDWNEQRGQLLHLEHSHTKHLRNNLTSFPPPISFPVTSLSNW